MRCRFPLRAFEKPVGAGVLVAVAVQAATTSTAGAACTNVLRDDRTMPFAPMSSERCAVLSDAPLTYGPVGVSLRGAGPVRRWQRRIGERSEAFDVASERLLTWGVHEGAGLRVVASSPRVVTGSVVELFLGFGRLVVRAPCRVVAVVDEPGRRGFAYGTLPGHPESGEEAFLVEQDAGGVRFTVLAVSRPASRAARFGGPLTRAVQDAVVRRYLHASTR